VTDTQQMFADGKNGSIVCIEFTDDGTRVLADVEDDWITENQFRKALVAEFGTDFHIRRQQGFWFATGRRDADNKMAHIGAWEEYLDAQDRHEEATL